MAQGLKRSASFRHLAPYLDPTANLDELNAEPELALDCGSLRASSCKPTSPTTTSKDAFAVYMVVIHNREDRWDAQKNTASILRRIPQLETFCTKAMQTKSKTFGPKP